MPQISSTSICIGNVEWTRIEALRQDSVRLPNLPSHVLLYELACRSGGAWGWEALNILEGVRHLYPAFFRIYYNVSMSQTDNQCDSYP